MIGVMVPSVFAEDIITNQHFAEVLEEPDNFVGVWTKLTGVVQNKQVFENGISYVFLVGGIEGSKNEIVYQQEKTNNSFSVDDCLVVEGSIQGSSELTNLFDATWDVPWINVGKFEKIDCLEALFPAMAESNVSQLQQFGESKIIMEKIQISKDHTRILFTVENNSDEFEIFLDRDASILIQDRLPAKIQYPYVEFDELGYSIPYGIIEKGWLVYETIEPKPFEIRLHLIYDDSSYDHDETEIIFKINFENELNFLKPIQTSQSNISQSVPDSLTTNTDSPNNEIEEKIDAVKSNILKKYIPDNYYFEEYDPNALDFQFNGGYTILATTDDEMGNIGMITITQFDDSDKSWNNFNEIKLKFQNVKNISNLSATCYEGGINDDVILMSCVKEDMVIQVISNSGENELTMKQTLDKIENSKNNVSNNPIQCGAGTESVNGICQVVQTTTTETSEGGGCLIATATYGSEMSTEVQQLRELRDNQLLNTESGTVFMSTFNDIYYSFSPIIADMERQNPLFKEIVKIAITPMISILSLMENANSESEVLGLGLSVIMLNIGMYLGVPAVVIVGIRKITHIN